MLVYIGPRDRRWRLMAGRLCVVTATGVRRNGGASDSRSGGWEFESRCPCGFVRHAFWGRVPRRVVGKGGVTCLPSWYYVSLLRSLTSLALCRQGGQRNTLRRPLRETLAPAAWSSGIFPAQGAGGPGFNSQSNPAKAFMRQRRVVRMSHGKSCSRNWARDLPDPNRESYH